MTDPTEYVAELRAKLKAQEKQIEQEQEEWSAEHALRTQHASTNRQLIRERDALRAENERQAGFINEIMQRWPWGDIDGCDLQDIAVKYGMLTEVEGGFDPDIHEDPTGACDRGDSFFLRTYKRPAALDRGLGNLPKTALWTPAEIETTGWLDAADENVRRHFDRPAPPQQGDDA